MPVDGESVAIEDLVSRTEGLSGAEVVAVCHEAAMAGLAEGISVDKVCHHLRILKWFSWFFLSTTEFKFRRGL